MKEINFHGAKISVPDNAEYVTMDDKRCVDTGEGITSWTHKPTANISEDGTDGFWIGKYDVGCNVKLARSKWPKVKWYESLIAL